MIKLYEKVSKPQYRLFGSHGSDSTRNRRSVVKIKQTQTISVRVDYQVSVIEEEIFTSQQGTDK